MRNRRGQRGPVKTPTDHPAESLGTTIARGVVAGVAGTVVMTAFQLMVEMPLTRRAESYAPAGLAEKLLPIRRRGGGARRALNYAVHFGVGAGWGAAHAFARRKGLPGQRAVGTVFGAIYAGDAVLNTALGLYKPWRWTREEWATDLGEKLILAEATALVYWRLEPGRR